MPNPNKKAKNKSYILIILSLVFISFAGFILLYISLLNPVVRDSKEFSKLLDQYKYTEAKDYKDSVLNSAKSFQKTNFEKSFQDKLNTFADKYAIWAASDNYSSNEFEQKYKGFDIFIPAVKEKLLKSSASIIEKYARNELDYEKANTYINNFFSFESSIDLISGESTKLNAIKQSKSDFDLAEKLFNEKKITDSIVLYEKVIKEDISNYIIAQDKVAQIRTQIYNEQLDKAKSAFDKKDYFLAVKTIEDMLKNYPDDKQLASLMTDYKNAYDKLDLVEYKGKIEHVFTHCLIAYPELGFGAGGTYDIDCISVYEFKKIIQSMYDKGYILVRPSDFVEEYTEDGITKVRQKPIKIPQGKKPVVFSIDDMVYDSRKLGNGMVDKLIIDEQTGNIKTYTKMKNGEIIISDDNECIPIIDNFVKEHPDFSYNGAKLTLALTGFEGIFGYRTYRDSPNKASEIVEAKKIAQKLIESGYEFASHSYKHGHMKSASLEDITDDMTKWKNEVQSILGVKIIAYVYPYGEASSYLSLDQKNKVLFDAGFRVFCGVSSTPFFYVNSKEGYIFMDRRPFDGNSLRKRITEYEPFFNTRDVYDHEKRAVKFDS